MRWDLTGSIRTPNLKSLASPVFDLRTGFKIQFLVTGPWLCSFWGYFMMLEMGLAKVYPCTEFEVSSFSHSRFTEGGLKFENNSAPGTWPRPFGEHFVIREMGLARIYPYTKFEVSSFTRSKDTSHVPLNGWMREGVCPNSRVDLRRFLTAPHEIWHQYSRMVNA